MNATATHDPRFDELLPAYALGALDADELRELEAHLAAGCPTCDAELRHLQAEMEMLGLLAAQPEPAAAGVTAAAPANMADAMGAPATPAAPPGHEHPGHPEHPEHPATADLRRRVLEQVAAEPKPLPFASPASRRTGAPGAATTAPGRTRTPLAKWMLPAAALFAAAVAGSVWGIVREARLGTEIAELRTDRARLAARAEALEHRVAEVQAESERLVRSISVVTAPGVQLVSMSGMNSAQKATGRTYVSNVDHRAVFYAYHLPSLAADKSYELWVVDNDERKMPVGLLQVDARGEGSVMVDSLIPIENIQAWVVTIEPRGGRPQPTGPIALAG